jgi:hypothetical protein
MGMTIGADSNDSASARAVISPRPAFQDRLAVRV